MIQLINLFNFSKITFNSKVSFEKILFYLISALLFISLSSIKLRIPWSSQLFIFLITFVLVLKISLSRIQRSQIANGYVMILILSFALIVIYQIVGFDHSQGVYLYKFTRVLPLFFAGILVTNNSRLFIPIIIVFCASSILSNLTPLTNTSSFIVREELESNSNPLMYNSYSPYLHIAPAISSILTLLLIQSTSKKLLEKYFFYFLFLCNILIVIRSGFANTLIILITSFFIIFLLNFSQIKTYKIYTNLTGFIIILFSLYFILTNFAPNSSVTFKISNIVNLIFLGLDTDMNFVSGGRFDLMESSWNTFLANPLFGVGSYQNTGFYNIIGSHSTVIDNFGQFGLIGGILLNGILLSWIYASVIIFRSNYYKGLGRILIGVWSGFFLACILNPYFLSESIDHFIFILAGITVGIATKCKQSIVN